MAGVGNPEVQRDVHRITHQQVTRTGLLHPALLALQISSAKTFMQVAYIENAPAYQVMLRSTDLSIFESIFQGAQRVPTFVFFFFSFFAISYYNQFFKTKTKKRAWTQIRDLLPSDLW